MRPATEVPDGAVGTQRPAAAPGGGGQQNLPQATTLAEIVGVEGGKDSCTAEVGKPQRPESEGVSLRFSNLCGGDQSGAEGAVTAITLAEIDRALRSLVNRSLAVPSDEFQCYLLVPMVADFLRKKKPEVVEETGGKLERRAYALIVENGYSKHERFPELDATWPSVAPAIARFQAGENGQLQEVCDALYNFFEFTGRWDEWLGINKQAEAVAVAAGDESNAGWRAYQLGWIHYLRGQADAVLACADRAAAHWEKAFHTGSDGQSGVRELAFAIRLRGLGHKLKKDYAPAAAAFRQAAELHRSLVAESSDVASALNDLADTERLSSDFAAAERDFREALRVARAFGDVEGTAIYTGNLGSLALNQQDRAGGEERAREALPLAEKLGRQELIAINCQTLAESLVQQGKGAEGRAYGRRSVEIFARLGSPSLAIAQKTLAKCEAAASEE